MQIIPIKRGFSNIYLVKDRKAILVDTGAPNEADKILTAVQKAGVNIKDISLLLHTHGHFDHSGSTAELKRRLGIPVAVHSNDAFMLRNGTNGEIKPHNLEAQIVKAVIPSSFEVCEPDILIEEEITLTDFGVNGKVFFTPGHTKGSISILFENREAIIGDVMLGGWVGGALFASRPNYHYFIEDLNDLHNSMKKIFSWQPSKLYVGHGGPLQTTQAFRRFENIIGI